MVLTEEQKEILASVRAVHGPNCKAIGASGGLFLVIRPAGQDDRRKFNETSARAGNNVNANTGLSRDCTAYPEDKAKVALFEQMPFLADSLQKQIARMSGAHIEEAADLSDSESAILVKCRAANPRCIAVRCVSDGTFIVMRGVDPAERTRYSQATKLPKGFKAPDQTVANDQMARSLILHPVGNEKTSLLDRLPFLAESITDKGILVSGGEIEELGND